ncbi:hypothetical protein EMIT07CA2_550093 [Brevibacillus sp. IT-7CA2]
MKGRWLLTRKEGSEWVWLVTEEIHSKLLEQYRREGWKCKERVA